MGAARRALGAAALCVILWTDRVPLDAGWYAETRLRWCPDTTEIRVELQTRTWRRWREGDAWRYDRDDGAPAQAEPDEAWWQTQHSVVIRAW
jgi:hypothetical protein